MPQPISIRKLAVQALDQWEQGHAYAESIIQQMSQHYNVSKEDRNLLNTIVINTLRHLRRIDFWIQQLRERKIRPPYPKPTAYRPLPTSHCRHSASCRGERNRMDGQEVRQGIS